MPRVVPSQVVAFINSGLFPDVYDPTQLFSIDLAHLSGLIDLVEQIPDELLTMDNEAYQSLICGKARIRDDLASLGGNRSGSFFVSHLLHQAIVGIRGALAKCPDESPAPGTSELNFIPDADLRANLRNDIGAVHRALANGEWKAATVLAGSAVEALLLWALKPRPSAEVTSAIMALKASGELTTKPDPNDLERWNLYEFIQVAEKLGVVKPNTAKQTRLAKDFRNFIHPGVAQRLGEKCDRATAFSAVAGMEHVVRDLTP